MFVGPMKDDAKRTKIVTKLGEAAPDCGFKRTRAGEVAGNWARISAVETILEWGEDEKPKAEAVRVAVTKALDVSEPG